MDAYVGCRARLPPANYFGPIGERGIEAAPATGRPSGHGDHRRPRTMTSFEIVEVNPVIDEHNRTADVAVELTLSALGKRIL